MSLGTCLGFVGLTLVVGTAVRWLDPSSLEQLSRRTGLSGRHGWLLLVVAAVWLSLPLLAGAETTDGADLWLVGPALSGVGFDTAAFAATSVDGYRLLARADRRPPATVTVGDGIDLVATSDLPAVDDEDAARAPFSGRSAVHVDWLVQTCERVLGVGRKRWGNVATGGDAVPFTLGRRCT